MFLKIQEEEDSKHQRKFNRLALFLWANNYDIFTEFNYIFRQEMFFETLFFYQFYNCVLLNKIILLFKLSSLSSNLFKFEILCFNISLLWRFFSIYIFNKINFNSKIFVPSKWLWRYMAHYIDSKGNDPQITVVKSIIESFCNQSSLKDVDRPLCTIERMDKLASFSFNALENSEVKLMEIILKNLKLQNYKAIRMNPQAHCPTYCLCNLFLMIRELIFLDLKKLWRN